MPTKTNYEKTQISKSEPKILSFLCTFKQVLCSNTGFLIEAHMIALHSLTVEVSK
jgi:hypothetical protein